MPVVDSSAFADSTTLPDFLRCAICVIGTGPAGMTIARELSGTPLRITILESGGMERQAESDALNEIENVGWPRAGDQWSVRNRIVGGSSATWTGRCVPFDEIDFQNRDWVEHTGWPLDWAELVPYFERSAAHLGLTAGNWYAAERPWALSWPRRSASDPDPDLLLPMLWQYSRDPLSYGSVRFGGDAETSLGPNVTLVTNATVLRVNATPSGAAVESVEFADAAGRRWTLPVSTVALCAGGIENARLLLCSDNVAPHGLGNDKDLVGRFLMDHPRTTVASFDMSDAKAVLRTFRLFKRRAGANIYHPGLRLSSAVQRSERLLNCAIWLREHRASDGGRDSVKRLLRAGGPRATLAGAGLLAYDLKEYLLSRRGLPDSLHALTLDAMCEQAPNYDSRLTLSERRDHLGMRLPRIDWRVCEEEARALRLITVLTVGQLPRMGLDVPVEVESWVRDGAMIPQTVEDAAHPMGTTRMADDRASGVVDARCQVHGVDGLFIGGSSVFPTGGHANPTQMIVALAARLADTLKTLR